MILYLFYKRESVIIRKLLSIIHSDVKSCYHTLTVVNVFRNETQITKRVLGRPSPSPPSMFKYLMTTLAFLFYAEERTATTLQKSIFLNLPLRTKTFQDQILELFAKTSVADPAPDS
jgi:hypothetical protein